MSNSRPPDQLTLDAQAALDAGMSYGHYMAQKLPIYPVLPTTPIPLKPSVETERIRYCKICGDPFDPVTTHRIKYCSDECCKVQHRNYIRQYRAAQQPG